MDVSPEPPDSSGDDQLARQRRKHRVALSGQPVPGSSTMTLGELAQDAEAASSDGTGADGVHRFLVERGYSPATIAAVLRCLDLDASEAVGGGGVVTPIPDASTRDRRRTLAQLEAMLLEE